MQVESSSERIARISVDIRRVPWIRRLAADYAYDFRAVAPFFAGDPSDRSAWTEAIARTQAHVRQRQEIAAVVSTQQQRRRAPERAIEAGAGLADPRAVAIVTGQQAGLFGGPLFTLLKALTALKLADQVRREHNVPAIAVFWIDAEDHDWEEIRSCTVFGDELTLQSVALPRLAAGKAPPVATVVLDDAITDVLDELEHVLPHTEFRSELLAALRDAYVRGAGMAGAFGCWLERVLGDRGLVVYDSHDPAAKPLASEVFVRDLSTPGLTAQLAAAAGSQLAERGYHAQIQPQVDSPAVFLLDGDRRAIRLVDGQFVVGDKHYPSPALLKLAAEQPTSFSPNVLLRPIVQDTIFPTVCYVAGPSELAYLGQLRGVYDHFGVPMPLMYPRASATLVDAAALRFLTKYDLPFEALRPQDEAVLNELLASQIPQVVEDSFGEAMRSTELTMGQLIRAIPALDSTLEGAAKSTLGRIQLDLQALHGKMLQAAKKRDETLRRQFLHARALAFPNGHPQERTVAFVSFLNRYGPALVERLDDELPLDMGRHWIITV